MKKSFLTFALVLAAPVFAQQQGTTFTPSPSQHRKLVSQREKISKLQARIANLQIEFSYLAAKFHDECRQVALGNHWPESVQCDPNSLMFYQAAPAPIPQATTPLVPAKPPTPAEEPKKP